MSYRPLPPLPQYPAERKSCRCYARYKDQHCTGAAAGVFIGSEITDIMDEKLFRIHSRRRQQRDNKKVRRNAENKIIGKGAA